MAADASPGIVAQPADPAPAEGSSTKGSSDGGEAPRRHGPALLAASPWGPTRNIRTDPPVAAHMKTLTLAAGCFWCLEAVYSMTRGVESVVSGYTGGHTPQPDYYSVCSGTTGHAEAMQVTFDPEVIPEDVILGIFFTTHDPTSLNRQGNDVGTQYRSAMFYRDEQEKEYFAAQIEKWQELFSRPIVTTLEPLGEFFPAEPVHQQFYDNNPGNGYCTFIIDPKVAKARRQWAEWVA